MEVFILFIIFFILLVYFLPKNKTLIFGGGVETKKGICDKLPQEYKDIISTLPGCLDEHDKFNEVIPERNLQIFTQIFDIEEYNLFRENTLYSKCYEYIKELAALPEIYFTAEDYIYDPSKPNKATYAAMTVNVNINKKTGEIIRRETYVNSSDIITKFISPLDSLTHNGKTKLFIADLQALIYLLPTDAVRRPNGEPKYTVIYIGSAPGHQTWMLADKFKNVKFILYDGAKFSDRLRNYSNVTLNNQYFGDDDIKKYKDKVDILISDVRLMIKGDVAETEIQVHKDMLMQQKWVIDIKPRLGSMLKFRPPYKIFKLDDDGIPDSSDYTYLGGTVYWQTFPHIQSTEGRLLSTRADIERGPIPFNYEHYENAACEHNLRRVWCTYKPSLPDLIHFPGFDRCLDCSYLLFVLTEYITKYEPNNNSPKTILNLLSFVTRNTKTLICSCEKTVYKPKLSLYIHGLWQNETRFEKHLRYLKMWMAKEIAPDGSVA
jgi:hypothetical protein